MDIVSTPLRLHVEPFLLLLNQYLLLLLYALVLHLLLRNQLNCQLTCLLNDHLVRLHFPLAGCGSLHYPVQQDRARVHIIRIQQLLADLHLASDDGVHFQFQYFLHHQFHLGGTDSFLYQRVGGDVEVGLIQVLFGRVDGVAFHILVLALQCSLQCFGLLHQRLQLLGGHHRINLGHLSPRSHERRQHLGVAKYILVQCDGIIGVPQLPLPVCEHTLHAYCA